MVHRVTDLASIEARAARHAALGDPIRLAIVDELAVSDRAPIELRGLVGLESNLLAHHLDVLEEVGLISRSRSSGDGRRRYVHLIRAALDGLTPGRHIPIGPALFICTANSARSQLAAALWRDLSGESGDSAGTHPVDRVNPGAVAAASRAGLDVAGATPRELTDGERLPGLVVTVCDRAHEELAGDETWLHWSIPDPVPLGTKAAFDATVAELRDRIESILDERDLAS
jgi:protein-tyrosine-phosphatase/DNA-binding transcriptional ArsR family regulator